MFSVGEVSNFSTKSHYECTKKCPTLLSLLVPFYIRVQCDMACGAYVMPMIYAMRFIRLLDYFQHARCCLTAVDTDEEHWLLDVGKGCESRSDLADGELTACGVVHLEQ